MKTVFLEGDKGIGKSTLWQQLLKELHLSVNGFYVRRIVDEEKKMTAYELKAASELSSVNSRLSVKKEHIFIENREGKQRRNLTVFAGFGCQLLDDACASNKIILLDEIGGVELLAESFVERLSEVFNQPQKIIGVFKSEKNYQHQKLHALNKLEIDHQRNQLKQAILHSDGKLITLTEQNYQTVENELRDFLIHSFF